MATGTSTKESTIMSVFDCPLCIDDMTNRTPKLLPCGHSFCERCLQNLAEEPVVDLICSTCWTKHKIPGGNVSNFPTTNLIRMKMIENFQNKKIQNNQCAMCSPDGAAEASYFCEQCNRKMCSPCKDHHLSLTIFKTHNFRSLKYDMSLCSVHKSVIQFCCEVCWECLCVECTSLDSHKNHGDQIMDIKSGVAILKNKAEELWKDVKTAISKLNKLSVNVLYDNNTKQVNSVCFQDLNEVLEKLEILDDSENEQMEKIMEWNETKSKVEKVLNMVDVLEKTENAVASYTNIRPVAVCRPFSGTRAAPSIENLKRLKLFKTITSCPTPKDISIFPDGCIIYLDWDADNLVELDQRQNVRKKHVLRKTYRRSISSFTIYKDSIFMASGNNIYKIDRFKPTLKEYGNSYQVNDKISKIHAINEDTIAYTIGYSVYYIYLIPNSCKQKYYDYESKFSNISIFNTGENNWSLCVSDSPNNSVHILSSIGLNIKTIQDLNCPRGTVSIGNILLVAEQSKNRITAFDKKEDFQYLGVVLSGKDGIKSPEGLAYHYPFLCVTESTYGYGAVKMFKLDM